MTAYYNEHEPYAAQWLRNDMAMTPDPNWYGLVFILLVGIAWVLLCGRYADDDTE